MSEDFASMDKDWIGLGRGLLFGFSLWPFCGAVFFPWGHGVFLFFFLFSFLLDYWGLRGSEPWGCLWIFPSFSFNFFLFSMDIGTFLYTEHDLPY